MITILKTTPNNLAVAIQEHVSIKHKLQNIEGLPTLELDFLSENKENEERPNLHQKQQMAKATLEKKFKVCYSIRIV